MSSEAMYEGVNVAVEDIVADSTSAFLQDLIGKFSMKDLEVGYDKYHRMQYAKPFTVSLYARGDYAGEMEIKMNRRIRKKSGVNYHHLRYIYLLREGSSMSIYYWHKLKSVIENHIIELFKSGGDIFFSDLEKIIKDRVRGLIERCKILYHKYERHGEDHPVIFKNVSFYSMREYNKFSRKQEFRWQVNQRKKIDDRRKKIARLRRKELKKEKEEKLRKKTIAEHKSVFIPR